MPAWDAFDSGLYNRFYFICHRRWGKDINCLSMVVRYLFENACVGTYALPLLKQSREVIWEGMDNDGNKFIDTYIPPELIVRKNNTTMSIEMKNQHGTTSILRLAGTDHPDSLRGGNSKIFVLSEWPEHDPYAWTVVRPIVRANNGIVIFNGTPKGENHGKVMFEAAQQRPNWYVLRSTVEDTDVFDEQGLAEELQELIDENGEIEGRARYDAEYMCSFEAPVVGSYYGQQIRQAEQDGRITSVPYESTLAVYTAWDLGIGDATAIWFYQQVGKEIRVIDYYESSGEGIEHYVKHMRSLPYVYASVPAFWPHDGEVKELGTGKSRKEVADSLGLRNIEIVPVQSLEDGIQAVRSIFSKVWFDAKKCERGIQALKNYKKDWDDKGKTYRNRPKHDWSSHGADAFRYMALSYKDRTRKRKPHIPEHVRRRMEANR